ncbi:MAG: hypothetical protein AAB276_03155, partial [Pseudomonadota bacterium]
TERGDSPIDEFLDAVDKKLEEDGVPPSQIKTMRQMFEEGARLKLQQYNDGKPLTEAEERRLKYLESKPEFVLYTKKAESVKNELEQKAEFSKSNSVPIQASKIESRVQSSATSGADAFEALQGPVAKSNQDDDLVAGKAITSNVILMNEFETAKKAQIPIEGGQKIVATIALQNPKPSAQSSGMDFG